MTPSFSDRLFYQLSRIPLFTGLTLGFSFRAEGGQNVPRTGPALLLSNHESFLDPVMIGISTTRPLHFLARKTLFTPSFGWIIRKLNAVPVDQAGVAKEGLRTIIELLKAGKAVVVFPEGERTWKGDIQELKPGIQLILRKTRAPIIPVGISGAFDAYPRTQKMPRFSPFFMPPSRGAIAISVGKPMDGGAFADMPREELLPRLRELLQAAKNRAVRYQKKW